jgi:hypothetical protein
VWRAAARSADRSREQRESRVNALLNGRAQRLATLLRAAAGLETVSRYESAAFLPSESRYESTFITLLN